MAELNELHISTQINPVHSIEEERLAVKECVSVTTRERHRLYETQST